MSSRPGGGVVHHCRAAERWPAAFPGKGHLVRPLASNLAGPVAEAMGWSGPYAYAVLRRWKFRLSYCRAVLAYDRRVDLDGMVTEQTVVEEVREQARRQLAFKAERRGQRVEGSG